MPIRIAVVLVTVAACSAPPPVETVDLQPETGECIPRNYPCLPNNPWGEVLCDVICGGEGYDGRGFCLSYSPVEDVWCSLHPGQPYRLNPAKMCDSAGNPTWQTHCVPGWLP